MYSHTQQAGFLETGIFIEVTKIMLPLVHNTCVLHQKISSVAGLDFSVILHSHMVTAFI